ncbi:replication initiation protein [Rhodocytophaga aerolata]|uniref:Replication initiation protein n=1 Tax=Rhodocytophaga aerolata TaxID=455078 RepID=A0ABT8RHP4_9BACT|nr:replication initiation protein [Rhodocytophaga aerolata]MDO1451604.1 replication initiation protein [Rhodocytophaga aerolata]
MLRETPVKPTSRQLKSFKLPIEDIQIPLFDTPMPHTTAVKAGPVKPIREGRANVPAQNIGAEQIEELNDVIMAQYNMSLYERRIFIKVLELLPESITHPAGVALFEPLIIDAREIIADSNLKGESAFSELQKATMSMIQHVCRIAEKDGLLQTGLISSAKYLTGKGQIRIHIDPALHPYLLRVKKHFSGEQLQSLIKFKSYYSQCFYEWFSKSAKSEKIIYISLYALRTMLRIEEQEYERYYDLKRFVIGQAGKELKGTPFEFTFKEKRSGRKVIGLQFYLT